jgi:hypothetical protein
MVPVKIGQSTIEGLRDPIDYLAGHGFRFGSRMTCHQSEMAFVEPPSRSIFSFEHDLRANASRLPRGKTGTRFSGSCSMGQS